MILQALVSYYENLAKPGKIAQPGWASVKVSYALELNDDGEITNILSVKSLDTTKKKMIPQNMGNLPAPVKRTVGIAANFLCDNSTYLLGADLKDKPERAKECFQTASETHRRLLGDCGEPAAKVLLRFFENWNPEKLNTILPDEEQRKDVLGGANLVFRYRERYLQENPAIRQCWQTAYAASEGEEAPCLVTGRMEVPATLHPSIKGIPGAQSSGASLVSFNAPAFCSYGHEQGMNAPTSEYAAFAYGTALNYLIASQRNRIGDTTVVFWAESAEEAYGSMMDFCCWGDTPQNYSENDLKGAVDSICAGKSILLDETLLDPNMRFYLLGLAPNAARLSVRFFLRDSFGNFIRNIQRHQDRLNIVRTEQDKFETIPLWMLMNETVNQNSRDKNPTPSMAGDTLRAILNDAPYPATLLNGVELRIRADRKLNRNRAAIIKAYYLKKTHPEVPKEVLQVSLNTECKDTAYVLGRLFSVLESIQNAANPGINTTIRDKYFSSASATPAVVFPTLINLAQKHLRKIDGGLKVILDKQLTELLGMLDQQYPAHLSLPQQGAFQIGYYHQMAARYTKKEEK